MIVYFGLTGLGQLSNAAYIVECNENQLKQCADNAEPLLKDKELVVPDSQRSVNQVCRYGLNKEQLLYLKSRQ